MPAHDLVFFSKRSTPKVLVKGEKLDDYPDGYGTVTKRRPATEAEERVIAKGKWVRVDEKSRTPADSNYKTTSYRPKLAAKRKAAKKSGG